MMGEANPFRSACGAGCVGLEGDAVVTDGRRKMAWRFIALVMHPPSRIIIEHDLGLQSASFCNTDTRWHARRIDDSTNTAGISDHEFQVFGTLFDVERHWHEPCAHRAEKEFQILATVAHKQRDARTYAQSKRS